MKLDAELAKLDEAIVGEMPFADLVDKCLLLMALLTRLLFCPMTCFFSSSVRPFLAAESVSYSPTDFVA